MDGPGQGVTLYFNKGCLDVENEKAHQVMLDFIEKDSRLDKNRIGILGSSTGGYFVARTAGTDKRIKACIVWGGSYSPMEIVTGFQVEGVPPRQPPHGPLYMRKFCILFGTAPDTLMKDLFPKMTMKGLAEKIMCPLLIIHGAADPIFSAAGVQRIHDEAKSKDKTIKVYPGGWHCAAGYETEVVCLMVDWMEEHLK
jgi:dienelactone hydrolase